MGWWEALVVSISIFWGLQTLGEEIRKGLVEAAKVANKRGEDHTDNETKNA